MLTDYEAWVLTRCRLNGREPPYSSRSVARPVATIGLVLVGTLLLWAYERPRAIGPESTGVFIMSAETQPAIGENGAAP